MKFIGEIYNVELRNKKLQVNLEKYHRTATGSLTNTKVFLFPRILQFTNHLNEKIYVKEIIVSQYPPHSWDNIWKIAITVNDKPGATETITKVLKDLNININSQESLMTHYETNFSFSTIADFSNIRLNGEFLNSNGNSVEERKETYLKILTEKYNTEFGNDLLDFKFGPVNFLNSNSQHNPNQKKNIIEENRLDTYFDYNYNGSNVSNGKIEINTLVLKDLGIFKQYSSKNIPLTVNSDTEEKYSILRFFRPNQCVIHLDIVHINEKGAINQFCKLISDTNSGFNIINSYNRIEDFKTKAHWYVMIDCTAEPSEWKILFDKLSKIDTVLDVQIINYTDSLKRLSLEDLPDPIFGQQKMKWKLESIKLKSKIEKLKLQKQNSVDTIIKINSNYKIVLRFTIVIAILFLIQLLFLLYFAYMPSLDINVLKDFIHFIAAVATIISLPSSVYFVYKLYSSNKVKNENET